MKFVKTIGIILLFALLASTAAAITENKDLPTQTQIIDFVDSVQDPSVTSLSETSQVENPSWKWDTWKDTNGDNFISFYYTNPDSKSGYGSLYFDNSGNKLSIPCGKYEVVKSYLGEEEKEETVKEEQEENEKEEDKEVTEEPKEEEKEEIEEDKEIEEEEKEEVTKEEETDKEVSEDQEIEEEEQEEKEEVSSLSNEDKIASIIYYFNTKNMNSDSLELCLRHYFGEE